MLNIIRIFYFRSCEFIIWASQLSTTYPCIICLICDIYSCWYRIGCSSFLLCKYQQPTFFYAIFCSSAQLGRWQFTFNNIGKYPNEKLPKSSHLSDVTWDLIINNISIVNLLAVTNRPISAPFAQVYCTGSHKSSRIEYIFWPTIKLKLSKWAV